MSTTTNLDTLKINYLTQAQYDAALADDQINENELYLTPASAAGTYTPTADTTAKFDLSAHMNSTDMTSTEITNFVNSLNVSDINAIDYVVEEGSVTASPTGAFNYYRKWNSGKAEFWYSYYSLSGLTTATWSSPIAYKDVTTFSNIWSGVFTTINTVHILTRDSQSISVYPLSWTTSGISSMRFVTVGTKSNNAYGISLYAFGTWK